MIIDILVLIVLLASAGIAFMRGFIREVLTIAGVVGGLIASYFLAPVLIPHMNGWLGVEEGEEMGRLFGVLPYDVLADILSYGLIFIIVVILLSLLSHFLAEGARSLGLGAVDRSLGFVFGIIRGALLLGLLYLPVHLFIEDDVKTDWFSESRTHIYIEKIADAMASYLPEETEEQVGEVTKKAQEAMDTRQKLQEIDLLKGETNVGSEGIRQRLLEDAQTIRDQQNLEGYDQDFREKMDDLIDQNAEDQQTNQ